MGMCRFGTFSTERGQLAGFLWPCARLFLLVKYTQLFFSRGSGDVEAYQSPPTEEGNRFTRGV